jgi:hypothetical protein
VEAGGRLEQTDSAGFTPLLGADFNGHYDVVKYVPVGLRRKPKTPVQLWQDGI